MNFIIDDDEFNTQVTQDQIRKEREKKNKKRKNKIRQIPHKDSFGRKL
jgi:hypothetical protein